MPDLYQPKSMRDTFFIIEVQKYGCCPPARGATVDHGAVKPKVASPALHSRMEEGHNSARVRVNGGKIRSFEPVAKEACQGQILE
jgi:hypothetical protein